MTKTNYCSYCMGTGKKAVAHDLLLRSPEAQRKYMEHVEASARACTHCNGTGRIGVSEMTDNTFLQEAAKVLYERYPQVRRFHVTRPELYSWDDLPEFTKQTYAEDAAALFRWLLTREPTEQMIQAGFDAPPIPPMRAQKQHYAAAYRAMNAAFLKEITND